MQKVENELKYLQETPIRFSSQDVLSRSIHGNYELRVSGNPYEIGYKTGKLTDSLYQLQETFFFDKVAQMTGTLKKQRFLLKFLRWYNRDLIHFVPKEYQEEIYGLSQFNSSNLDSIASPFQRSMMLHGAHDIGHAMQDLMLVGCSSFALHGAYTKDESLWIGRNFDFYVSDDFAQNKIVSFVNPEKGYKYASVTWPGMLGVISGMNEKGLTVTINAGKSSIPLKAKMPISLLAKEIVQFASTIDEAIEIARNKQLFVSESILIGSALDNDAAIIEISPKKMDVVRSSDDLLICTNHFQSTILGNEKRNQKHKATSHSQYRYELLEEEFTKESEINEFEIAKTLRKTTGLQNKQIGFGNEKALNQLRAHHAVIFHPKTLRMWVSNNPYQLGAFDLYDLNDVFSGNENIFSSNSISEDPFIKSDEFKNLALYRKLLNELIAQYSAKETIPLHKGTQLIAYNPEFWEAYYWAGKIAFEHENYVLAQTYFNQALAKEVTTLQDVEQLNQWIKKCQRKTKKSQK